MESQKTQGDPQDVQLRRGALGQEKELVSCGEGSCDARRRGGSWLPKEQLQLLSSEALEEELNVEEGMAAESKLFSLFPMV